MLSRMTGVCTQVVHHPTIASDRRLSTRSMVGILCPLDSSVQQHHQHHAGINGQPSSQRTKMNTNREHMTGGEMMVIVPAQSADDHQRHHHHQHHHHQRHHHQHQQSNQPNQCTSGGQQQLAISLMPCNPERSHLDHGIKDTFTGKDICDIKAKRVIVIIPPTLEASAIRTSCTYQKSTDDSFDSLITSLKSPRSPTSLPHSEEGRARGVRSAPLLSDRNNATSLEPQKYENIPVPGIIPRSKVSSSPTPQTISGSRTDPITFYSRISCLGHEFDKETIIKAEQRLKDSGFYYDQTSVQDAKKMLHSAEVGTFLVRISSQPSHFFALSVKTNRGTTSIRIAYDCGRFRLDADPDSVAKMPGFDCIISLIEYYVLQSASDARNKCVFLESNGRRDTPVILTRPYRDQPQSLRHICRRNIHYHFSGTELRRILDKHSASVQVRQYLQSYPYAL